VVPLLIAAALITALVVIAGNRFRATTDEFPHRSWGATYRPATELPCPWCGGETDEADASCPSCHRMFGATV